MGHQFDMLKIQTLQVSSNHHNQDFAVNPCMAYFQICEQSGIHVSYKHGHGSENASRKLKWKCASFCVHKALDTNILPHLRAIIRAQKEKILPLISKTKRSKRHTMTWQKQIHGNHQSAPCPRHLRARKQNISKQSMGAWIQLVRGLVKCHYCCQNQHACETHSPFCVQP